MPLTSYIDRRVIARAALWAALAIVTAVTVVTSGRYRRVMAVDGGAPQDGWRITGVHVQSSGEATPLTVAADVVAMRRVRVGPFRLGFAWTLAVQNLTLDVMVGGVRAAGTGEAAGPRHMSQPVTSVRVDGFHMRVHRVDGASLDVAAGTGEIRWRAAHRIRLDGGVRVRSEGFDVSLPALDVDLSRQRFVANAAADARLVERINEVTARVGWPNPRWLTRALGTLTASAAART